MRCVEKPQMKLGQINISAIKIDPRSRDDIPKILQGLQHLYMKEDVRTEIFLILEENISPKVDKENGRPGMDLWQILVLGVLRLNLNEDYDRVQEHANNHRVIRQMLGHSDVFDLYHYPLQTIKDNVRLLTPELLDKINQVVVKAGHAVLKKKTQKA